MIAFIIWLSGFIASFVAIMIWMYKYSILKEITIGDCFLAAFVSLMSWFVIFAAIIVKVLTLIPYDKILFKNNKRTK